MVSCYIFLLKRDGELGIFDNFFCSWDGWELAFNSRFLYIYLMIIVLAIAMKKV